MMNFKNELIKNKIAAMLILVAFIIGFLIPSGESKKGSTYEDNMVIEFDEMKKICWQTIQQLDHTDLDNMFDFPTSENIAMWIFEHLKDKIPISGVKLYEGNNKYCEITK